MLDAPEQAERAAEVVHHEVYALDPQRDQGALQELGIPGHLVVEVARLVGVAEAGHVERDGPAELAGGVDERGPVAGGAGVAVHEHDGLARVLRAGFDDG